MYSYLKSQWVLLNYVQFRNIWTFYAKTELTTWLTDSIFHLFVTNWLSFSIFLSDCLYYMGLLYPTTSKLFCSLHGCIWNWARNDDVWYWLDVLSWCQLGSAGSQPAALLLRDRCLLWHAGAGVHIFTE